MLPALPPSLRRQRLSSSFYISLHPDLREMKVALMGQLRNLTHWADLWADGGRGHRENS